MGLPVLWLFLSTCQTKPLGPEGWGGDLEKLQKAMGGGGPPEGSRGSLGGGQHSVSHCLTSLSSADLWDLDLLTTEAELQQGRQAVTEWDLERREGDRRGEVGPSIPVSPQSVLRTPDLAVWDHTAQNLLRMGLAFLVLVALMCLLAEDCLWRKRNQEKANGASSQECRRRFRTQRRLDK